MELNNVIFTLRNEKGYTQECLAEMLGVSTAAVSKWERANAYPDITLLPKIAEIFNVSIDYLLGYDMTSQKTISEIIAQANELRCSMKSDEAEALIKQTLARYPNDLRLRFELARHRFVNARYKKNAERDRLFSEATDGFQYIVEHDDNEKRRAWSLHFLTLISLFQKKYDQALAYNAKLLGVKGLYPRAMTAVIEMEKEPGEDALRSIKSCIYECVKESAMLVSWIAPYLFSNGDNEAIIREYLRAVKVYEEFTDCGWIYDDLSYCYEVLALAYANIKEYDTCLDYLEKAGESAVKNDNLSSSELTDSLYAVLGEIEIPTAKISACQSMLDALTSDEREAYAPIRETERYKAIICRLEENKPE